MRFFSIRLTSFYAALFGVGLLIGSAVLQNQGLQPCPLCVLQRVTVFILTICFIAGTLFVPTPISRRFFYGVIFFIALGGGIIAGRHIFLQNQMNHTVQSCGADLATMVDSMPFSQAAYLVFEGTGECTEVQWEFAGFTLPEWNAISFGILGGVALIQIFRRERY